MREPRTKVLVTARCRVLKGGSRGIAPKQNCTHFLKIGFLFAGGGFYSYYIHQGNKSDKERKIVRKKVKFYAYKKI